MKIRLKAPKPLPYEAEPRTLGGHLKKRRHELGLLQKEVAKRLGVNEWTVGNWEKDRTYPAVRFMPRLIQFLGYDPFQTATQALGDLLAGKRRALGLSRKRVAAILRIDEATVANIENGTSQLTGQALERVRQFVGSRSHGV